MTSFMLPLLPYTRRDPLLLSATQTHSTAQKYYDRKTEKTLIWRRRLESAYADARICIEKNSGQSGVHT